MEAKSFVNVGSVVELDNMNFLVVRVLGKMVELQSIDGGLLVWRTANISSINKPGDMLGLDIDMSINGYWYDESKGMFVNSNLIAA